MCFLCEPTKEKLNESLDCDSGQTVKELVNALNQGLRFLDAPYHCYFTVMALTVFTAMKQIQAKHPEFDMDKAVEVMNAKADELLVDGKIALIRDDDNRKVGANRGNECNN